MWSSLMTRLVVVSNRVPALDQGTAAGGLAVGVAAALEATGGLWFGWSGETAAEPSGEVAFRKTDAFTLATFILSEADYEGFYEGLANRALWPLCHNRLDLTAFNPEDYAAYRRVNRLFAEKLHPLLAPGDIIWIHDYHLFLLGHELRQMGVAAPLGFFLHIPFPPPEVFLAVPWYQELTDGLCTFDLLGFQTRRDVRNFTRFVTEESGAEQVASGRLSVSGHELSLAAYPIGIDVDDFAGKIASPRNARLIKRLSQRLGDRIWIVGVDRLDYTKGIAQRFRAFEMFLERNPSHRGRVSFLQIAAPSREGVPEYMEMRSELETICGHINGRYTELDWVPLIYINKSFGHGRLTALYRLSRVGLVTPLRDGMNMVAKEYVAAQQPEDPGVLLLSRFSGAAEEMDGAVIVNPYDVDGMAEALRMAVEMPLAERTQRWTRSMDKLRQNTIHHWGQRFVNDLRAVRPARQTTEVADH
jgi:trehalose 6-phosphate synthase